MKKAELIQKAIKLGIENASDLKVKELRTAIKKAESIPTTPKEVVNQADIFLTPIKANIDVIRKETAIFVQKGVQYLLNVGVQLVSISEFQKTFAKEHKLFSVVTSDGLKKADLCTSKTKDGVLGFWDFLRYENFIPCGYAQVSKYLNVGKHATTIKELVTPEIAGELNLGDLNNLAKLGSFVKEEKKIKAKDENHEISIDGFKEVQAINEEIKTASKRSKATEKPISFEILIGKNPVKVSYKASKFRKAKPNRMEQILLAALLQKHGLSNVPASVRTEAIENQIALESQMAEA